MCRNQITLRKSMLFHPTKAHDANAGLNGNRCRNLTELGKAGNVHTNFIAGLLILTEAPGHEIATLW